jgi:hypothetical protein
MNVTSYKPGTVVPDGTVTTMLYGLAVECLDGATLCCESEFRRAMGGGAKHLLTEALDRQPPDDFEDRWEHLLDLLTDQRRVEDQGPNAGEEDKDFAAEIAMELEALAGRPL